MFIEFLKEFFNVHPIISVFILALGFPEIEIAILVIIGILALAGVQ